MQLLEPASKIKSIILLKKYFNIEYKKTSVFRELLKLVSLKEKATDIAIKYAKKHLGFDFTLVFYDVTTLYFETHKEDDFRRYGFSKDNKQNQPQILIGLVVNEIGFPIYYDIFNGNAYEGKTMIPIISSLKKKYKIDKFMVIADAGMLLENNLKELEKQHIDYVVGSRVKNLNLHQAKAISEVLKQTDKKIIRQDKVIYEYSTKRARKDKTDNGKQIEKAHLLLNNPSKIIRKSKFLSIDSKKNFKLNETAIEKYRLLEGIKGYRTNVTKLSEKLLIERYKDLWRVEQSFRIAKSDLSARPIYHRKRESIKYHILIVFVALCMTKVIELDKKTSLKNVIDDLKDKWTITLVDEISGNLLNILLDKKPH